MLIIQISDTHIVLPNKKSYGIADTAKNLSDCINAINALEPKVDVVLVTGDISNNGQDQELLHAKSILDKLNAPYYVIPGNHDHRENLRSIYLDKSCPVATNSPFINYVIDQYEVRLIALDSTIPEQSGAELCPERLEWLEQQLAKNPEKPTLLFMHHPPVKCGVLETDIDGFIGADLLGNIVEKYTCIKAILCGHIHLQAHVNWRNTVVSIAPSTQMRLMLDLTMQKESHFYLNKPAFQMHYWTAEKNLISYPVLVHKKKKPYLFERVSNTPTSLLEY